MSCKESNGDAHQNGKHHDVNRNQQWPFDGTKGALSGRKGLRFVHELPPSYHEPFILSGYRNPGNFSLRQCLVTAFSLHNETINIWSHLIAFIAFAVYFYYKFQALGVGFTFGPTGYPLMCFAFGICLVFISSAGAHLFCCLSEECRHICFYLDYAAISVFTLTAAQAFYFYSRPSGKTLFIFDSPHLYLGISAFLSVVNVALSCLSRHYLRDFRFLLRAGPNLIKILYDTWPFVARINHCTMATDCNAIAVTLFYRHWLCYGISGITYAAKIPERWMPGVFDFFGHSHHFLHIVTIFGNYYAFLAVSLDMTNRAELLSKLPAQPTVVTTFGMLLVVLLSGGIITWVFIYRFLQQDQGADEYVGGTQYTVIYRREGNYEKKTS
ncbi:membrane progestin receptor gamma-B [Nematostella vectensis]|uniref:membrane progestin receptor gamma-B n=1 Tax=Nematostella vectensis TaxID=45351 RepID=UPI00207793A3|nr:membrane progestin receptor gamma-B [Nematostella vectensis]